MIDHYQKVFEAEDELHCDVCPANWICTGECQAYSLSKYGKVRLNRSMCRVWDKAYRFVSDNLEEILLHNSLKLCGQIYAVNPYAADRLNKAGIRLNYDAESNICKGERI